MVKKNVSTVQHIIERFDREKCVANKSRQATNKCISDVEKDILYEKFKKILS